MTQQRPLFSLDDARGCLQLGDQDIELRPKTYEVLRHLAANAGRLVSKQELHQAVWPDVAVTDDLLVQCVRELREKLGDQDHSLIKTVHRRGYRLDVPIPTRHPPLSSSAPTPNCSNLEAIPAVSQVAPFTADPSWLDRVKSLFAIIIRRLRCRAVGPHLAIGSAAVGVSAVVVLGFIWTRSLPLPSPATSLAAPAARDASIAIPLTVQKFATDMSLSDLTGFAEKITDDLTNYLSRVKVLRVVAAASPDSAGTSNKGITPNVRYIVHGSAREQDAKIRLNVGLLDAASGVEVWSHHFTADRATWPALQDDMLRSITFSIHVEAFQRGSTQPLQSNDDVPLDQLLTRAWSQLLTNSHSASFDKAGTTFRALLQRDPASTSAMLGLALYNIFAIADLKLARDPHLAEAEALLRRAYEKDKRSHMVHYGLGALHLLQGNLPASLQALDRSIEINPSYPPAYARKGRVLIAMQRYQEGLDAIRYALKFNRATTVQGWQLWAGWAELELGRDEEARASFQAALGALPDSPHVRAGLASLHALQGEWVDADRHVLALRRSTPLLSDEQRLRKLNRGADGKNVASRLRQGLELALNSQAVIR